MLSDESRDLFDRALKLPPPEREAFVRGNCDDAEIVRRVLDLLEHHEVAGSFLEEPASVRFEGLARSEGDRIAEFEVVRELGRGGMGIVYLAKDTLLGRQVALKILAPHLVGSERAIGRFKHEARAVAALSHPGIIPIYRCGEEGELHYLAMEYVEGSTLGRQLRDMRQPRVGGRQSASATGGQMTSDRATGRGGRRQTASTHALDSVGVKSPPTVAPPGDTEYIHGVARAAGDVADALEHAHRHGVIHRDVKPSNIIIDEDGSPRLTDFGIAKLAAEEPLTITGDVAGTAHYMSPEQADAALKKIDHRTDIFSLGVVLYEALTLRRPFEGETTPQILSAIKSDEPRRLRSVNPSVPKDLETVCHKALEKSPSARYQTAAHMAADLRCWLRGDPILARPRSVARRTRDFVAGHRLSIASASIVGLLLLVGVLVWGSYLDYVRSRVRVTIESEMPDCYALIQTHLLDGTLGEALELGDLPINGKLVDPGYFRLTVVSDDRSTFAERDVVLDPEESRNFEWTADPVQPDEVINAGNGMVLVACNEPIEIGFSDNTVHPLLQARTVQMPPFYVDRCEVTIGEFYEFCTSTGRPFPEQLVDIDVESFADRPMPYMNRESVETFVVANGKRLLTASEWQVATQLLSDNDCPGALGYTPPTLPPMGFCEAYYEIAVAFADAARISAFLEHTRDVTAPDKSFNQPDAVHAGAMRFAFGNLRELTSTMDTKGDWALCGSSWADIPLSEIRKIRRDGMTDVLIGFRCAVSARPPSRPKADKEKP